MALDSFFTSLTGKKINPKVLAATKDIYSRLKGEEGSASKMATIKTTPAPVVKQEKRLYSDISNIPKYGNTSLSMPSKGGGFFTNTNTLFKSAKISQDWVKSKLSADHGIDYSNAAYQSLRSQFKDEVEQNEKVYYSTKKLTTRDTEENIALEKIRLYQERLKMASGGLMSEKDFKVKDIKEASAFEKIREKESAELTKKRLEAEAKGVTSFSDPAMNLNKWNEGGIDEQKKEERWGFQGLEKANAEKSERLKEQETYKYYDSEGGFVSPDFKKETVSGASLKGQELANRSNQANIFDPMSETYRVLGKATVQGLLGLESKEVNEAMSNGSLLNKLAASGGNLAGLLIGLKGVGAITKGTAAATTSKLAPLGDNVARYGTEIIKGGVDFTLLGQVHSTVRGDTMKQHLQAAGRDFWSGAMLDIGGLAVGKLPKLFQPIAEASVWAGITKLQGGDNESALIQGILMGGLRGYGIDWRKPIPEDATMMIIRESEKLLGTKGENPDQVAESFISKTKGLEPLTERYQKLEVAATALLNKRLINSTLTNLNAFKEGKLIGLFAGEKFAGNRAGIEKPAPLPVKETDLEMEAKKYDTVDEFISSQTKKDYRETHQIDSKTASPVTKIDESLLNSFIDEYKYQYGYPSLKSKEVNKLKDIMKDPDADIKIYRSSSKNELNTGDWVTIDKDYANDIKKQNGGKVHSYTVKAKDLFYPNTLEGYKELPSLAKWGAFQYRSSEEISKLTDIWNKANEKTTPVKQGDSDLAYMGGNKKLTPEEFYSRTEKPKLEDWEKDRLPWESEQEFKDRTAGASKIEDFENRKMDKLEGKKYLEYQAQAVIDKYIEEVLKPGMGQGVEQGGIIRDSSGNVTGRYGRQSNNDKWYQDFYKENNRKPTVKDLREVAVKHLNNGYEGYSFEVQPDGDFLNLQAQMKEMGIEMPTGKLSKAGMNQSGPKPLTVEKNALKAIAKKGTGLVDLSMQGEKGERLRGLKQEMVKRMGIEKKVREGELELVSAEDLVKVRKSGGVGQAAVNLVDKLVGGLTAGAIKQTGKVLDKITNIGQLKEWKDFAISKLTLLRPRANLEPDAYKAIEDLRKAQNREFKGVKDIMNQLGELTEGKLSPEDAFKYLQGEKVEIDPAAKKVLDIIRDEMDIEGLRQVMNGRLSKEVYFENMGKYMRRLYMSHRAEGYSPLADSYNNLKNALRERGLDGKEAENVIAGIATNNIKDEHKAFVGIGSPKVGGGFEKKRKLGEDKVSLAIRDFLGEIQDPQYAVASTLFDLKRSRLNHEMFTALSHTDAIQAEVPAGRVSEYVKLEGRAWGPVDGKYMHKDVKSYIDTMKGEGEKLGRRLTKLNNFIKANLTVRNPSGQVRNLTSNFATSQSILGHNYISASGVNDLVKAIDSLKKKDNFYQELLAYGRIGDTGITRDLGDRLEDLAGEFSKTGKVKKTIKAIDELAGKSYEFGDNLFLMANYKKLRAKGLKPVEAIKEASRVTPDYGEVSPLIAKWRRSAFGLPFVTWRYKVYPEIVKSLVSSPVRASMPIWFPLAVGNLIASQLDLTDAEKEVLKPKMYRDGFLPIGRGEDGDVQYFNFSQYTPFADAFKGRNTPEDSALGFVPDSLEGYINGMIPVVGSFPIQASLNLMANYDPFTARPVTYEDAWTPAWGWDIASYMAPQLLPFVGSGTRSIDRVLSGDMEGGEALIKSLTGFKVENTGVGDFEQQEKYADPSYSLDKDKQYIYKRAEELSKIDDREKANVELNKLYDQYPDQEKYITDRVKAEKNKVEGRSKTQTKIRNEITSLSDIAKRDKVQANQRLNELYDEYPEFEKYITDKVNEVKSQQP